MNNYDHFIKNFLEIGGGYGKWLFDCFNFVVELIIKKLGGGYGGGYGGGFGGGKIIEKEVIIKKGYGGKNFHWISITVIF